MTDTSTPTIRTISAEVHQEGLTSSKGRVRIHAVPIDRPLEKGGSDQGPMGGELLLLALGGCFMSNLLAAARSRDTVLNSMHLVVEASLEGVPERMTHFSLTLGGRYEDRPQMEKLISIAERGCIVANTLRGAASIDVALAEPGPA